MEMNRKGLELIRPQKDISSEFDFLIESELLPPLFKKYLEQYQVGKDFLFAEKIVLDESLDEYWLSKITMYEDVKMSGRLYHATLDYIFESQKLNSEFAKYKGNEEHWNRLGFVQIGLMTCNDVLLLGVQNSNKDEIWRYGDTLPEQCTKLEDDIFQFIGKLQESINAEDLEDWGISKNQIYRNPNEKIWRVRRD